MSFRDAIESVLRKYSTFSGRASRSEYWYFYLFTVLLSVVLDIADKVTGTSLISLLANLALLLPTLAVFVRRLHDSGRSAWWLLAPMGTAFVGAMLLVGAFVMGLVAAFAAIDGSHHSSMPLAAVALLVLGVIALLAAAVTSIVLMCLPSTPGANKYGPNPNEPRYLGYGPGDGSAASGVGWPL